MKKLLTPFAVLGVVLLASTTANAQNLLINPGVDDPPVHEGVTATGWTLVAERTLSGPAATANFADFADREAPAGRGLWARSFIGTAADPAQAILSQVVPALPGVPYRMSGWAHFETYYAGGLDIVPGAGDIASPTETYFGLEFLDLGGTPLPGSVLWELRDDGGQVNDPDTATRDWQQHVLTATAPLGTVNVRVSASMVDGIANVGNNPQSVFFDDFSLTVVPEPASAAIGLIGVLGLLGLVRRR